MKKITGFSLVELLTALVLSTLIVLGVGQAFISQKVSYRTQNDLSRIQQTGRFVIEYIGNDIRRAGFPGIVEEAQTFFNAIIPTLSADGGGSVSDTITIMYQSATDCLGNLTHLDSSGVANANVYPDGNFYAKNRYRVVGGNLVCTTFDKDDTAAIANTDVVLTRGVQNMQVMYGLDNQFVSASTLATDDWANITGVRVSFLVNSIEITTDFTDSNTYVLLNADSLGPFNDSQRRRVFTTTSTIRNRLDRS